MAGPRAPLPPLELVNRVCDLSNVGDPLAQYEQMGRDTREQILELLPEGWSFEGKRVLDLGCGAGRVLRHFTDEARDAEIWGCDIDEPSIAWLREQLCPPLHVVATDEAPPLPFDDGSFDLIWAISVFSHLTDLWAEWLLEVHRLLADSGILIATFVDHTGSEVLWGERVDEDRVGMNRLMRANPWASGGPVVLHSEWWIRAHWGRAFSVEEINHADLPATRGNWALLRKKPVSLSPADLRAPEPGMEQRELRAAEHNLEQLERELERAVGTSRRIAADYEGSWSWRLTRPMRAIGRGFRRRRRPDQTD
jgi:SAM-dependent methyltransferase